MKKLLLLALTCTAGLGSCTFGHSSYVTWSNNLHKGVVLAEVDTEEGTKQTWRVYPGNNTQPRIELSGYRVETTPKIGVYTSTVTRKRAEAVGAEPFRGVWITKIVRDKPAAAAGIQPEMIVLKVNGEEVNSSEQFNDLIQSQGVVGQPLTLTVFRKPAVDEAPDTERMRDIQVSPYASKSTNGTTDSIPLEYSKGVQSYTGMQVATVKQDLANRIWGSLNEVTLVTGVVPGSPAYDAGLRAGDRLTKLDGQRNPGLEDVRNSVLERLNSSSPSSPTFDLAQNRSQPIATEDRTEAIQVLVDGPLGPHDASFDIEVVGDQTRFYVPILVGYESNVRQSRVSFLNFIFQFGFNYSSDVHESSTRRPVVTSDLSILPLGMFGVKHGLHRSQYRLFWLINWSTENYDNSDTR